MASISGVALNPQNIVPLDPTISTLSYAANIVPNYQNLSSGNYTVYINSQSDLFLQTSDRGNLSNIGYFNTSTVADTLLGSGNLGWFQTKNDLTNFPLTTRTSPFATQTRAVAYNGSYYVAVGSGSNTIATSFDGIAWTPRSVLPTAANGAWSVAWNGSIWLVGLSNAAAINNAIIARSSDGVTWTTAPNRVFADPLSRFGWSGSLLICGQNASDSRFYTTTNAINWTTNLAGAFTRLIGVAWNGVMWLGVILSTSVVYSFDGITFTSTSAGLNINILYQAVAWSPTVGVWVVAGTNATTTNSSTVATSFDGINWAQVGPATAVIGLGITDVIWTGSQFFAVGTVNGNFGAFTSPTGAIWTNQAFSTGITTPNAVAFSSSLSLYVAGGSGGSILASSPTGVTWTQRGVGIFTTQVNDVKWNGTLFVAVGSGTNSIAYSFNGIDWVGLGSTFTTFTTSGNGVIWLPELALWVASGTGTNQMLTSRDGITWTASGGASQQTQITGLAWSPLLNLWVAAGSGANSLATSIDGIFWSGRTGAALFSTRGFTVIWSSVHNLFIAGGQGTNTILTSPDGLAWTPRTSPITTAVQGIGFNGTRYVAVGSGTNVFATSDDGITWTGRGSSGITGTGIAVTWSPSLSLWVAVGTTTNSIATSTDGITWVGRTGTSIFSTSGYGIHWSSQLAQFVAGGQGTNTLATSRNGTDWDGFATISSILISVYALAWNGTLWVAAGTGASNTFASSTDGINWTGRGNGVISTVVNGLAWNGALWVAVGQGTNVFATSTDGLSWTGRGSVGISTTGVAVIWAPYQSLWIAVGNGTNCIATSQDGVTWTGRTGTTIFSTSGFGLAAFRNLIVAGGEGTNTIATSPDGITWTGRGSTISNRVRGIAYSPTLGLWVAMGAGTNSIATSTDGLAWTGRTGTTLFLNGADAYSVIWNGNYFVATGGTSKIATSADGINWRANAYAPLPTSATVLSSAYRAPIMVAGGTGTFTLAYSIDNGYSWIPNSSGIFGTSCFGVAWNGNIFVAVGSGTNRIATSPDGITWTARSGATFATQGNDVIWADGLKLWVAVGEGTNAIATSPDGITWTGRGALTIFTTAGDRVGWNGSLLVALGRGNNSVAISRDGISWAGLGTPITVNASAAGGLAWNGNVWVAVTNNSSAIWSSPNGFTWTFRVNLAAGQAQAVAWNGNQFLVTGTSSTAAATSPDGFTWTSRTGPGFSGGGTFRCTWNHVSSQWVAVGSDTLGTNIQSVFTSPNAITWTPRMTRPLIAPVNGFAWAPSLGLWVGIGNGTANIVSSTDGTTWIQRAASAFTTGSCVAWNGSLFVAGGQVSGPTAQIYTSPDGINWTSQGSGGASWTIVTGIAWSASLSIWVAVGANATSGVIASSTDGIAWTSRSTTVFGAGGAGYGVAVNTAGNLFVAVGTITNVFATSSDGTTWTGRGSTGITTAGRGIVWVNSLSLWVAVGNGTNSIATSPDGITWTGRTGTSIFNSAGANVATNNSIVVAVGTVTNSIAYSYDGINWTGLGTVPFGAGAQSIAWNSTTGQWVAGTASVSGNRFASSPDGQVWTARTVFSTSASAIAYQLQREKTYTIQNTHWTGRTSQQTFRILSS